MSRMSALGIRLTGAANPHHVDAQVMAMTQKATAALRQSAEY
jgi:hypothetical protein